ncbi:hypothetical protein MNBD_GAMMA01-420 [hydrothermal vent metagenome]|uniref:Lipoprotein n=1 Tax=hydrothermal vent metagenome TaxID=652676 RepID=A0A3B0W422_9ZZZZ
MNKKLTILFCTVVILGSCGTHVSRTHEKQRSPADIKISSLNLATNDLNLRFEYRSYIEKTFESINCDITFNAGPSSLNINQQFNIKLDAFSTEILTFANTKIAEKDKLLNLKHIDYSLRCKVTYDKGGEIVFEDSVLHLVPGSKFKYR